MAGISKNRVLRTVLSTLIALLIAASGITITVTLSVRLGWFNEKLLKTELGNNGYVSQSIDIMREEIFSLVETSLGDTSGLDKLLDEDKLYTTFYKAETEALSGKEVSLYDIDEFRAGLTALYDEKLKDVYVSDAALKEINSVIDEAVYIYKSYMHTDIFKKFYDMRQKISSHISVIIICCILIMLAGSFVIIKMYHYRRHAFPYILSGLAASVIGNTLFAIVMFRSSMLNLAGVKPECYKSLAKSMTQYGGYVCLIVTGFLIIALCLIGYFISKSKKK